MVEKTIKVINETGLHARPVTQFVNECKKYTSEIILKKGEKAVKGNSIISIMSLAIRKDDMLTLQCHGLDEEKALDALSTFLATFKE